MLALSNENALAIALTPLIRQARRFKHKSFRGLGVYFKFTGPLLRAFDVALIPNASARRRTGHTSLYSHHSDRPYAYSPDHIPQLLWGQTFAQDFASFFAGSDMGERHIRSFIAMDLVRLCGPFGWNEAAHELGFIAGQATGSANKAIGLLNSLGKYEAYIVNLHATAAILENVSRPFNFGSRRRQYSDLVEFPYLDWRLELQAHDIHPGKPGGKCRWAASHAWALLTAGHPRRAPAFQRLNDQDRLSQLEIFYRFNRDHLEKLLPFIRRFAASMNGSNYFAGEVAIDFEEN